jgi:hypothetical protein
MSETEKEQAITYWNIPVPRSLDEALQEAIRQDWHRTKTEFIRELVRQELRNRGFHPPKDVKE